MKKFKYQKGFTLIELLVVIAIIGILSSVVLASLNKARSKARDAKRMQDIGQLVNAIEMFYSDNGYYPACGSNACTTTGYVGGGNLANLQVVPNYLKVAPIDPINIAGQYGYYYSQGHRPTGPSTYEWSGNNQHYMLLTRLENSSSTPFTWIEGTPLNLMRGQ